MIDTTTDHNKYMIYLEPHWLNAIMENSESHLPSPLHESHLPQQYISLLPNYLVTQQQDEQVFFLQVYLYTI